MGRLEAALRPAGVNCGVPRRLGAAEAGGGSAPTPVHSAFEWAAAFEPRVTDWRSATGRWTRPGARATAGRRGLLHRPKPVPFKMAFIYVCISLVDVCMRS